MITILRFILLFLITSISTFGVQVEQSFIWDALGNLIGVELTDDRIDPDGRINISTFQNQKQLISFPSGFNQWNVFRSDTKFDAATMGVGGIAAKGAVKGSRALSAGFRYGSQASDSFASGYRASSLLSRSGGARLGYFEHQYSRTIATNKTLSAFARSQQGSGLIQELISLEISL